LLFGLSAKSKKKITLCDLCVFAVNYYDIGKRVESLKDILSKSQE
jgi:hypothetical protein